MEFRVRSTENKKTLLFLSWIGKHDLVTGSTIARRLKICLAAASTDTDLQSSFSQRSFKLHSCIC